MLFLRAVGGAQTLPCEPIGGFLVRPFAAVGEKRIPSFIRRQFGRAQGKFGVKGKRRRNQNRARHQRCDSQHKLPRQLNDGRDDFHGKDGEKLSQGARIRRHPMRILSFPFNAAADGIRHGNGNRLAVGGFAEGARQIMDGGFFRRQRIIHGAADVN